MSARGAVFHIARVGLVLGAFLTPAFASPPAATQFQADAYTPSSGFYFPDGHGAAGPNQVVFVDDRNFIIQTKAGGLTSSTALLAFWGTATGFPTGGNVSRSVSNPRIFFDPTINRWIATALGFSDALSFSNPTYYDMVAVSDTNDPTGTWKKYAFNINNPTAGAVIRPAPVYNPSQTGFSHRWIAMTLIANNAGVPDGCYLYVYEKAQLMSGSITTATQVKMGKRSTTNTSSLSPMVPTVNTAQDDLYLLETKNGDPGILYNLTKVFDNDIVNYTTVGSENVPGYIFFSSTLSANGQLGGSAITTSRSEIHSLAFDGTSLWSAQTVFPNAAPGRLGVKWFKWTPLNLTIADQGLLDDPAGTFFYDYPSISVNTSGDMMIGFTRFSSTTFPSAGFAFRAANDAAGTLQVPTMYKAGTHAFNAGPGRPWGAYSGTTLDPSDGLSFWTAQEFAANQVFNGDTFEDAWGSQWAKAIPPIAVPTGVGAQALSTTTIRWTWLDNSYNEANFVVRRSSDNGAVSPNLAANTTFYIQTGLTPNTTQQIYAQAFNAATSANSANGPLIFTFANPPASLAFGSVFKSSLTFSWSANNNPGNVLYRIERSTNGVGYAEIGTQVAVSSTTTGLTPGATYFFRVRAQNGNALLTAYSNVISTRTLPLAPPATPGAPIVTTRTTTSLMWGWADNANNETAYRVLRSTDNFDLSGTLPANTTFWLQTSFGVNTVSTQEKVRAENADGTSTSSNSSTFYTLANDPSGLALAGAPSTGTIPLSWSANGNPPGTAFELQKSVDGGLTFALQLSTTATTAPSTGLSENTTYQFRVRALNGNSIATNFTSVLTVRTPQSPPAIPTGVAVTTRTVSSLTWGWADNAFNENEYHVLRATDSFDFSGALPPNTTSWLQGGLGFNVPRQVIVRSSNTAGVGNSTASVTFFTLANVPSGLSGTPGVNNVQLFWSANGNPFGTTSYDFEASTDAGAHVFLGGTVSGSPSVNISGLPENTTCQFQVRAINGNGIRSAFAPVFIVRTLQSPPAAPSGVTVTTRTASSLTWGWADNSTNENLFRVLNASDSVDLSGALPSNTTFWFQGSLGANVSQQVIVRSSNTGGVGDSAASAIFFTLANAPALAAPVLSGTGTVSLTVLANGNPAGTIFEAERSTFSAGGFVNIFSGAGTAVLSGGLSENTTYFFRARALNGSGTPTAYSSLVSIRVPFVPPAAPGTPVITARSNASLTWGWADNATNETSYRVLRSSDLANISGALAANTTFWFQSSLGVNAPQQVRAQAVNADGTGTSGDSAVSFTAANAPGTPALVVRSTSSVTITWSSAGNPIGTGYEAERSTDGVAFTNFFSGTSVLAVAGGLAEGTTYFFRARAQNGDGIYTVYSATLSVPTTSNSPAPPTGFAVVARTTGTLTWAWTDNAANEAGYRVRRTTDNVSVSGDLPPNTVQYIQTGLGVNVIQDLFAQAFNAGGVGNSGSYAAYTLANPPGALTLQSVFQSSAVFSWATNGNPAETLYHVERSTNGIQYTDLGTTTNVSTTTFGLTPDQDYFFRVRAENGDDILTAYNAAASTHTIPLAPAAPGTPAVTARTTTSLTWGWVDNATNETANRVLRTSDSADLSGTLPANTTFWLQSGLGVNTPQQVKARSENAGGTGTSGDSAVSYTLANAPGATTLQSVFQSSVSFSWTSNGNPGGTIYHVERSTDGALFAEMGATTGLSTTTLSLTPDQDYFFRVRAENGNGILTAYNGVVSTHTIPSGVAAPTGFAVIARTTGTLTWAWTDNAANEAGYRVRRTTDNVSVSGDLPPNTVQYIQTGLGVNVIQDLFAQAFNAGGVGNSGSYAAYTLANAPGALTLQSVFQSSAAFSWAANGNPAETLYHVERSTNGIQYAELGTTVGTSTITLSLTPDQDYFFRVRAENGDDILTAYNAAASTHTIPLAPAAPGTPVADARTTTSLTWSWTDNATNETANRILRTSDSADLSGTLPANTTFWLQPGLGVNTPQQVKARSENAGGAGTSGDSVVSYTLANPPVSPFGVAAATSAVLIWSANGNPGGTFYDVERATDNVTFTPLASTTSTFLLSTSLAENTTYQFRVRAENGNNIPTAYASTVVIRTLQTLPAAPTGVTVSTRTASSLTWAWIDNAVNEDNYEVGDDTDGFESFSGPLPPNTVSWPQTGMGANTPQQVTVRAENGAGPADSAISAVFYTLANAPGATALLSVFQTSAAFSWTANGNPGGTLYHVERSTNGVAYAELGTTTGLSTTTLSLTPDQDYFFRVRAENGNGILTAYNAAVSTHTIPLGPAAPTGFGLIARTTDTLTWGWTDNAVNEAGYRVRRATDNVSVSGDLAANTIQYTQSGLTPNRQEQTYAQAFNAGGAANSSSAAAYTAAAVPNGFGSAPTVSAINLTWSANGNPAGVAYETQKSTDGLNFGGVCSGTSLGCPVSGLTEDTMYFFRVRAINGDSIPTAYSAVYSTRTLLSAPLAPSGVTVSTRTTVTLTWTWTDNAVNETSYHVLSATGLTDLSGGLPANTVAWPETELGVNTPEQVVVRAKNGAGNGDSAPSAVFYTLANAPGAPSVASVGTGSIDLTWGSGGNPAGTLFEAESSTDGVNFQNFFSGSGLAGTASGLNEGTTYFLRVRAKNGDGITTAYAAVVSTRTNFIPPFETTEPPIGVAETTGTIMWNWADAFSNETGFRILSEDLASNLSGDLPAGTTFWLQTGLGVNTGHKVVLEAFNLGGAVDTTASPIHYTLANPPTNFAGVPSQTSVALSWSANGNPPGTFYEVSQSTNDLDFVSIQEGPALSAAPGSLTSGATYFFRVFAANGGGITTDFASLTTQTIPLAPSAPSGVTVVQRSTGSLLWAWNDNANNETVYEVGFVTGGFSSLSGPLPPNTTTWWQAGLGVNSAHNVVVRATNPGGSADSAPSSTFHTLANPPSGAAVAAVFASSVTVTWSANGNPAGTSYHAEKAFNGGAVFTEYEAGTDLTATAAGLSTGTYQFRVRAENGDGILTSYSVTLTTAVAASNVFSLCANGGFFSLGGVDVFAAPGSVDCGAVFILTTPSFFPTAPAPGGTLNGVGVGANISSTPTVCGLQVTIHYQDVDVAGIDESQLVIARYDAEHDMWLPLPSSVDAGQNTVTTAQACTTMMQVMARAPSATVSTVKIYPNPARRSQGDTQINFTDLPVNTEIRIYTLSAEKVKELRTDSGGNAAWDMTNESGRAVASGTYIGIMKGAGGKEVLKLVVQE